ncbi:MAG: hypothetical protein COA47_10230 [Robiginitomaculum sp.]|nr:MAG: hypothetical protein COA47_10230 [Robiginitomaculum sp.]
MYLEIFLLVVITVCFLTLIKLSYKITIANEFTPSLESLEIQRSSFSENFWIDEAGVHTSPRDMKIIRKRMWWDNFNNA